MNDAEFCSDGHRQSYGEEQLLAMQRLVETVPPAQRTQRFAAHPGDPKSAAPAKGPSMALIGSLFHDAPAAITGPGPVPLSPTVPLVTAAIVLFRDHEHSFTAQLPSPRRSFQLALAPAKSPAAPAALIGQVSAVRIAIPPALGSRFRRRPSRLVPTETLSFVEPPPAATGRANAHPPSLELSDRLPGSRLSHPACRRLRPLGPAFVPAPLSLGFLSRAAQVHPAPALQPPPATATPAQVQYPLAPPMAVSLSVAFPDEKINEQLWLALESSPLGALLSATGYTSLSPAASHFVLPATASPKTILSAPGAPEHPSQPSAVGTLLAATRLHSVAPPVPVSLPHTSQISVLALGSATTHEFPVSPAPVRTLALLAGATSLRPLAPPSPAESRAPHNLPPQTAPAHAPHCLPAPPSSPNPITLAFSHTVLAVPPPANSAGSITPLWNAAWREHNGANSFPVSPAPAAIALPAAPGVSVPPPATAGAPHPHCFGGAFPLPNPLPAALARFALPGDGLLLASPVPCRLAPDVEIGARSSYGPKALQTVLRLRLPRHSVQLLRRYASAECVPVQSPAPALLPWCPPATELAGPTPAAAFPAPAKGTRTLTLRTLPVRLYRVPRAMPMAQPCGGKPYANSFGDWASPPAICASRLIPDDGKPRPRHQSTQKFRRELLERFSPHGMRKLWNKTSHLPSDLKWIAMVVPMIIGIWVLARPTTAEPISGNVTSRQEAPQPAPEETKENQAAALRPVSAPPVEVERPAPPEKPARRPAPEKPAPAAAGTPNAWDTFTARIASRASVNLVEDFRNGLSLWDGRGEWARSWTYDRAGTVRPGHMAVFQPTVRLRDYVFEMRASIERRSIQWVVRAANTQNYHFARLNVTPGAPLTRLELERWTVINGRAGRVTRLPLPHGGANQTLYAIRVEVHGDSITTYLQDQVIDTFNDPRLPDGGVGLVGAQDDRPRIYGIHVSHQNDFLGKLCSFLAPPPINTQGSD